MGRIKKLEEIRDFQILVEKYTDLVYSICYKITKHYFDAQDLTQETFLSVYKSLPTFDGQNERAWICRIATNKSLDYLKQANRRTMPVENTYFAELQNKAPTPEECLLEADGKERILSVCKSLRPPYDEIAIDYFYNEMTIKEISEIKGKKPKTVQTQVYRARGMIKRLWKEQCL